MLIGSLSFVCERGKVTSYENILTVRREIVAGWKEVMALRVMESTPLPVMV